MMIPRGNSRFIRCTRGQTMVEYVLILTFFAIVLLIPDASGQSALDTLLKALADAYRRFSYALSLPT